MFLGVILTSLDLTPGLAAPDRCGSCTRCIDACPTDAFLAPYQLDSNRCIAYLTIEKRGAIPPDKNKDKDRDRDKDKHEDLRSGMGRHIFGCDICQDVCPWNRKAPTTSAAEFQARQELVNPVLDWLANISAEEFRRTFKTSPIRRAKRAGVRRNAVIAMGNSGDHNFISQLKQLATDDDEVVAQSAAWAIQKLNSSD
jgi:epoxyqueuosine reductase